MENRNPIKTPAKKGFALLITIMVVSVVVAVTLAIAELSLKQLELSVDSVDSELAFQAANAGLECARYWRREESARFESGASIPFNCFGAASNVPVTTFPVTRTPSNSRVYLYRAELTWGTVPFERCSQMDIVTMIVSATTSNPGAIIGANTTANSLQRVLPGYPTNTKTCEPGGQCTIAAVTGYSTNCANKNQPGTQRREILLEF